MASCRAFTPVEISSIITHFVGEFKQRDIALFMLGIITGFRISELLAVQVGWLVDGNGVLRPRLSVAADSMKGGKSSRSSPLPAVYQQWLFPWLQSMPCHDDLRPDDLVFVGHRIGSLDRCSFYHILRATAQRSAVIPNEQGTIGTHSMRKTFCAGTFTKYSAKDPANALRLTKEAMGHTSLASTEKYLPSMHEEVNEGIIGYIEDLLHKMPKPDKTNLQSTGGGINSQGSVL